MFTVKPEYCTHALMYHGYGFVFPLSTTGTVIFSDEQQKGVNVRGVMLTRKMSGHTLFLTTGHVRSGDRMGEDQRHVDCIQLLLFTPYPFTHSVQNDNCVVNFFLIGELRIEKSRTSAHKDTHTNVSTLI